MDWQLVLVAFIVTAAAIYLGRGLWRSLRSRSPCSTGCHCQGQAEPAATQNGHTKIIPSEQLILRLRRGNRS
jgi:hypothetical protein